MIRRAKSWIICYDEGYPLRLISSGSVFGGEFLSTSDVMYACYFLIKVNYIRVC